MPVAPHLHAWPSHNPGQANGPSPSHRFPSGNTYSLAVECKRRWECGKKRLAVVKSTKSSQWHTNIS